METEAIIENSAEKPPKKVRHRKKQLYSSILQQMEFYFSDSNLTKDRFLSQLIQEDPNINVEVFLKFNKIRKLTTNLDDIRSAVKKSSLIALTEDKNSIFRKEPIKEKQNVDECTIYVERLKPDSSHDWLSSVFSEFGKVSYVSIPKFRHNNTIKGFAFVEFDSEQEAQTALDYFEAIDCKLPAHVDPSELCSISTFEDKNDNQAVVDETTKRKVDDEENEEEHQSKKLKTAEISTFEEKIDVQSVVIETKKRKVDDEETEEEHQSKKLKTTDDEKETEISEVKEEKSTKESQKEENIPLEGETKKKKKHKKENKKKNYMKELGLQVLSKKEWKKLRNRYLDLQRKKMQEFKRHLHGAKFGRANYDEKPAKEEVQEIPEETQPKLEFIQGVIVKIKLTEAIADVKKLKNEIKAASSEIKYVDISNPGCEEVCVRFETNEAATAFCKQEFPGEKSVLKDEEEKNYWDVIMKDREIKFQKGCKKQRGRDKLLKKANKVLAKHTVFDE